MDVIYGCSPGNHELLSFRNAYHGMSYATMGITGQGTWKYKLPGTNMNIHNIMNPDPYRGIYGGSKCRDSPVQVLGRDCDCAAGHCKAEDGYLEQLEEVLKYSTQTGLPAGKNIAGFFAESIQARLHISFGVWNWKFISHCLSFSTG